MRLYDGRDVSANWAHQTADQPVILTR